MSGAINNTGAGTAPVPAANQHEKSANAVSQQDADDFANQVMTDDGVQGEAEEQVQRDEVIDLIKQNSFQQFNERQKERLEEMKKTFE